MLMEKNLVILKTRASQYLGFNESYRVVGYRNASALSKIVGSASIANCSCYLHATVVRTRAPPRSAMAAFRLPSRPCLAFQCDPPVPLFSLPVLFGLQ